MACLRLRSCVDLFKGRYIFLSIRTASLRHAKWIGRLWSKQNKEGSFKYTARLVPDLRSYLHSIVARRDESSRLAKRIRLGKYIPSQNTEYMYRVAFDLDGVTVRRLWLETSHEVEALSSIWQKRSPRNSCRTFQLYNGQLKQITVRPYAEFSAERYN